MFPSRIQLLQLLTAATVSACAAAEAQAPLLKDSRLEKPISVRLADRPLDDALHEIAQQTGVALTCTRNTRDDRVTLFVAGLPASAVLQRIAIHLDFQWSARGKGYELDQTVAARQREAALRDREARREWTAIQSRMADLARLSRLSMEEIDRLLKAETEKSGGAGDADGEARLASLREAREPLARLAGGVYAGLSSPQREALAAGREIRLGTKEGTLQPATAAGIHEAAKAPRGTRSLIRIAERQGGGAQPQEEAPPVPTEAGVTVRLSRALAPPSRRSLTAPQQERRLRLTFQFRSVAGGRDNRQIVPLLWSPDARAAAERSLQVPDEPDPRLEREVSLQASVQERQPGPQPVVILPGSGGSLALPAGVPLSRLLAAVSEATGLPVISDSFVRARLRPALVNGKRSARELLRTVAKEAGYFWTIRDGVLLLRSRSFFHDRPQSVPERILAPWKEAVLREGRTTLDSLAQLAVSLTDDQALGFQDYWPYIMEDEHGRAPEAPPGVFDHRYHVRFWATLIPQNRSRLAAGETLPVAGMLENQRRAFTLALTSPSDSFIPIGDNAARSPGREELAAGGFRLRREEMRRSILGGVGPDGQSRIHISVSSGAGSAVPPRIALPDGGLQDLTLSRSTLLEGYVFAYVLGGNPVPAKVVSLTFPQPESPAGNQPR